MTRAKTKESPKRFNNFPLTATQVSNFNQQNLLSSSLNSRYYRRFISQWWVTGEHHESRLRLPPFHHRFDNNDSIHDNQNLLFSEIQKNSRSGSWFSADEWLSHRVSSTRIVRSERKKKDERNWRLWQVSRMCGGIESSRSFWGAVN